MDHICVVGGHAALHASPFFTVENNWGCTTCLCCRLGRTASHATLLCQCVYDGDLDLLKCLLLAGCNVNAGDYDARTALHISAAEGNLPAVRLLLEVGRADVTVRDRWNNTPLMEARRVNAVAVMAALQAAGASASNSD